CGRSGSPVCVSRGRWSWGIALSLGVSGVAASSIIPKLDFVGFARLVRDSVENLGGVRCILPAARVAYRMILGAWRCLVLRCRLSRQAAPSLSSPVHGVGV
ncbi:unnamed protein product, partial [Brassica rapa]